MNSEDRLFQQIFADHLERVFGWDSVYAYNDETFGPTGLLGRESTREVVLTRDLRAAIVRLKYADRFAESPELRSSLAKGSADGPQPL